MRRLLSQVFRNSRFEQCRQVPSALRHVSKRAATKIQNFSSLTKGLEDFHDSATTDGKTVTVNFSGAPCSSFHAPWLWVNDPIFVHPTSGQKTRTYGQYPGFNVVSATVSEKDPGFPVPPSGCMHPRGGVYDHPGSSESSSCRKMLQITWDSGEESSYDLDWLSRCRYDGSLSNSTSCDSTSRITREITVGAINNSSTADIPTFDYREIFDTEDGLLPALQGIFEYGCVLVRKAPKNEEDLESTVKNLAKLLSGGKPSHGFLYGDVFHVESINKAHNIAYTTVALPPHQDLTYCESKPFLQLLHSVGDSDKVQGGESVLIDAMAAAEELRRLAPDLFDIMCQVEATFLKQRNGADMASLLPHIVTDFSTNQVVGVNWSPPFEGPLQIAPDLMDGYVLAYQAMECMLDNSLKNKTMLPSSLESQLRDYAQLHTWEYTLQPGDVLIFNNQRMLHGRREFSLIGDGKRHLIGCYTDVMETTSHYRILLRSTDAEGITMRNVGNGTRALHL